MILTKEIEVLKKLLICNTRLMGIAIENENKAGNVDTLWATDKNSVTKRYWHTLTDYLYEQQMRALKRLALLENDTRLIEKKKNLKGAQDRLAEINENYIHSVHYREAEDLKNATTYWPKEINKLLSPEGAMHGTFNS